MYLKEICKIHQINLKRKQCTNHKNAPTTNAASERVFSSFDRRIREKPYGTTLNLESKILFETNQNAAWLSGLDDSTKKKDMEIARKSAKTVLKDYQKRKMDIEERIR